MAFQFRIGETYFSPVAGSPAPDGIPESLWQLSLHYLYGTDPISFQTSGSTGNAKEIWHELSFLRRMAHLGAEALSLKKNGNALLCLAPETTGAKMLLFRCIEMEMKLSIVPASSKFYAHLPPNLALDYLSIVPMQLEAWLNFGLNKSYFAPNAVMLLGGAKVTEGILKQSHSLKDIRLMQSFGLSESGAMVALRDLHAGEEGPYRAIHHSVSFSIDVQERLKIQLPDESVIQTEDMVKLIDEHSFYWLGRSDLSINSGGIKFQIEQLEAEWKPLLQQYGISNYCIWKRTDALLGEAIVLILEAQETPSPIWSESEIKKEMGYRYPREIRYLTALPQTASGKVNRPEAFAMSEV
jgi:O-succinylbenzoic acid--CoA ligase